MKRQLVTILASIMVGAFFVAPAEVFAALPLPPNPQGSAGLQGTVPTPPPSTAATIVTPSNGATFTSMPVNVTGLCTTDLLVKMFANNVFVGSAMCVKGSYDVQIDLFEGRNDLTARIFDALDQAGPDSNVVTVNYNTSQLANIGQQLLTLTSVYARRGANPGEQLVWPITLAGGTPPYAISTDWGDGKPATLQSEQIAGTFNVTHTYATAGTYVVVIKATDKDGFTAFLQLVGQANGAVTQTNQKSSNNGLVATKTSVVWAPAAISIPLVWAAFWLGRRYEITELRRRLERQTRR